MSLQLEHALSVGSEFAKSFKADTVSGFASQSGDGSSSAITGLSGSVDVPLFAFVAEISFTNLVKIDGPSLNFIGSKLRILNTDTSNKQIQLFWWNSK